MTHLAFVDTETVGLDPDRHDIWEVALIVPRSVATGNALLDGWSEFVWHLPADMGEADPIALAIGGHTDRWGEFDRTGLDRDDEDQYVLIDGVKGWKKRYDYEFLARFVALTNGAHLVGAVPSFDEERLRRLARKWNYCPTWHYHLIDVEALALGWLAARRGLLGHVRTAPKGTFEPRSLPWKSDDLIAALGIDGDDPYYARHTALGDARMCKAIYERVIEPR